MKNSRSVLCSGITLLIGVLVLAAAAKTEKVIYAKGDVRGHMRQLGTALMMYAVDYDDVLPPMNDAKKFQDLMAPYVKDKKVLTDPHLEKPFTVNPHLSNRALDEVYRESFKNETAAVAVYQSAPGEGGARFALVLPQPYMIKNDQLVWEYDGTYDSIEPKIISVSYFDWNKFKQKKNLP